MFHQFKKDSTAFAKKYTIRIFRINATPTSTPCWKEHSVNHTVFHTVNHTVKFERFNSVNQRDHSVNTLFCTLWNTVWAPLCVPQCVSLCGRTFFHSVGTLCSQCGRTVFHSVGTPFTLLKRSNLTLRNIHHTVNNHHTVKHPLWTTVWTHWPVRNLKSDLTYTSATCCYMQFS